MRHPGAGRHRLNGAAHTSEVADKHVFFASAGERWDVENAAAGEYRQIHFEFLQPPRHTEEQVRAKLEAALFSTEVGTSLLFENSYCRVWDFPLAPGGGSYTDVHHHVLDYVFVYVAPGRLLGSHADGSPGLFDSINADGDVTWFDIPASAPTDARYAHGGVNGYSDRPMREYLVELK